MATMMKAMDEATDTGGEPPFGGGVLNRQDFQSMLLGDPSFAQQMSARMVFATPAERASLARTIERALQEAGLPAGAMPGGPALAPPAPPVAPPPAGPAGPPGPPAGPPGMGGMGMPPA